jgi:hypothetical protein
MYMTGATNPQGKNEDWMACSSDLIVVLDGATVRTATSCDHGPAWYTRKLGAAIIGHAASWSMPLREVLAAAIRDVAELHSTTCDLNDPAAPSAAVGIVRIEGDTTRYLVLGDITIIADIDGTIEVVSDDRVSQTATAERHEADGHLIGTAEKDAAMRKMKLAELAAKNVTGGYWIAGSDPTAAKQAIVGEWQTKAISRMATLSDGAARFVDLFGRGGWLSVLEILKHNGPVRFLEHVRLAENADPRGERYPRNKRSDDATVVYGVPEAPVHTKYLEPSPEQRAAALAAAVPATGLMGAEPVDPRWRT